MELDFDEITETYKGFIEMQEIVGSFKFSYALGRNILGIKSLMTKKDDTVLSIANAAGLKPNELGMYNFNESEDAMKAFKEFMKTKENIEFHKVDIFELEKLNLSAKNFVDLKFMINE